MDPKRKVSPQTRLQLSRAAKKRKRGTKGSPHAGEFMGGKLHSAFSKSAVMSGAPMHALPQSRKPGKAKITGMDVHADLRRPRDEIEAAKMQAENKLGAARKQKELRDIKKDAIRERQRAETYVAKAKERMEQNEAIALSLDTKKNELGVEQHDRGIKRDATYTGSHKSFLYERLDHHLENFKQALIPEDQQVKMAANEAHQDTVRQFGRGHEEPADLPSVDEIVDTILQARTRQMSTNEQRRMTGKVDPSIRGSFPGSAPPQGDVVHKPGKLRPSEAIGRMSSEDQIWLANQAATQNSPFTGAFGKKGQAGARRRLRTFTDLYQSGYSRDEAYQYVKENKGNLLKGPKKVAGKSERAKQAAEDVEKRLKPKARGKKPAQKYTSSAPSHEQFAHSINVPGVDKIKGGANSLKSKFPDASEADLFRYQMEQGKAVDEYTLQQNARWAHESRRQRMLGKNVSDSNADKGRVVFFTTNVGTPSASVPAKSLLGQYVIKKRKKMVVDDKVAQRFEVKGEFPAAVRDRHLIEISTGIKIGAEGRYGAFQNTGWRKGTKRSKGFAKELPLGAQVLRDPLGRPIYDSSGNIRYTEGYTRPFNVGTDRDIGLRIFLG